MKIKILLGIILSACFVFYGYHFLYANKWDRYYKNKMHQPPRELTLKAIDQFQNNGYALDLGCGVGNDTCLLLAKGWCVWAVDSEPKAIEIIRGRPEIQNSDQLITIISKFENMDWGTLPQFDLVCANYALPFCDPKHFEAVWNSLKTKIASKGIFAGHFFGVNHNGFTAAEKINMNFWTREYLLKIFEDFDIIEFEEKESEETSGTGLKCHSHEFIVIARKK